MKTSIRAILFDAVGTLICPDPPVADAYHRVGRDLGSSRALCEIETLFREAYQRSESLFALPGNDGGVNRQPTSEERERQRWRQVVGEVFADLPTAGADEALDRLWRHFAQPAHWRLYDDVPRVWDELTRRGYLLGIASNFDGRLEGICRGLAPLNHCGRLFISSRVGYPKPAPQFFHSVQDTLGLRPDEILLVGDDAVNDVLGAQQCGWQALLVCREGGRNGNAIGSLEELHDFVVDRG